MAAVEVGRVCIKTRGREAGKKCVIVNVIDTNYVEIVGKGVKQRKCNISHLEILPEKIEFSSVEDAVSKLA